MKNTIDEFEKKLEKLEFELDSGHRTYKPQAFTKVLNFENSRCRILDQKIDKLYKKLHNDVDKEKIQDKMVNENIKTIDESKKKAIIPKIEEFKHQINELK